MLHREIPEPEPRSEKRRWDRVRAVEAGEITVGSTTIPCLVLDISIGGVRVSLTDPVELPEKVIFAFEGSPRLLAHCRWVRGCEVGLELIGPVPEWMAATAVTPPRDEVEIDRPVEDGAAATMYAVISPRGLILRSTISLTPDEARSALGTSLAQLGPLGACGWGIARLSCSIVDVADLLPDAEAGAPDQKQEG